MKNVKLPSYTYNEIIEMKYAYNNTINENA